MRGKHKESKWRQDWNEMRMWQRSTKSFTGSVQNVNSVLHDKKENKLCDFILFSNEQLYWLSIYHIVRYATWSDIQIFKMVMVLINRDSV